MSPTTPAVTYHRGYFSTLFAFVGDPYTACESPSCHPTASPESSVRESRSSASNVVSLRNRSRSDAGSTTGISGALKRPADDPSTRRSKPCCASTGRSAFRRLVWWRPFFHRLPCRRVAADLDGAGSRLSLDPTDRWRGQSSSALGSRLQTCFRGCVFQSPAYPGLVGASLAKASRRTRGPQQA